MGGREGATPRSAARWLQDTEGGCTSNQSSPSPTLLPGVIFPVFISVLSPRFVWEHRHEAVRLAPSTLRAADDATTRLRFEPQTASFAIPGAPSTIRLYAKTAAERPLNDGFFASEFAVLGRSAGGELDTSAARCDLSRARSDALRSPPPRDLTPAFVQPPARRRSDVRQTPSFVQPKIGLAAQKKDGFVQNRIPDQAQLSGVLARVSAQLCHRHSPSTDTRHLCSTPER